MHPLSLTHSLTHTHTHTHTHSLSLSLSHYPLQTLGVERVVVGRELSVEEIASVGKGSNVEIEAFVHGALCVSYRCVLTRLSQFNFTSGFLFFILFSGFWFLVFKYIFLSYLFPFFMHAHMHTQN